MTREEQIRSEMDIVDRLRGTRTWGADVDGIMRDAADEIKRLREIVADVGCSGVSHESWGYVDAQINKTTWDACVKEAERKP